MGSFHGSLMGLFTALAELIELRSLSCYSFCLGASDPMDRPVTACTEIFICETRRGRWESEWTAIWPRPLFMSRTLRVATLGKCKHSC